MRTIFITSVAVLLAAAMTPALAAGKHRANVFGHNDYAQAPTPSYDACEALAVARGVPPGQGSEKNPDDHHNAFIKACLEGKIPR
jgi:hypothetical protein